MRKHFITVTLLLFVILSILFIILKENTPAFKLGALMIGNGIMAVLSVATYLMVKKHMYERPEAFVRGVFGATLLKLMACIVGIIAYVLIDRKHIHKPSVYILFGIYIIYTIVETWLLSRLARQAK